MRNNDLQYIEPYYLKHDITLEDCLYYFNVTMRKFAIVRKWPKEIGMVSENLVRDLLQKLPNDQYLEEIKYDPNDKVQE